MGICTGFGVGSFGSIVPDTLNGKSVEGLDEENNEMNGRVENKH